MTQRASFSPRMDALVLAYLIRQCNNVSDLLTLKFCRKAIYSKKLTRLIVDLLGGKFILLPYTPVRGETGET